MCAINIKYTDSCICSVINRMFAHIENTIYSCCLKFLIRVFCGYSQESYNVNKHPKETIEFLVKNWNLSTVIKKWRIWQIWFWFQSLLSLVIVSFALYSLWSNTESSSQLIFFIQMINGIIEVLFPFVFLSILLYQKEILAELLYFLEWISSDEPKIKLFLHKDLKWILFIILNTFSICCSLCFEYFTLKWMKDPECSTYVSPLLLISEILLVLGIICRALLICSYVLLFHIICRSVENEWKSTTTSLITLQDNDEMNQLILEKLKFFSNKINDNEFKVKSYNFRDLNLVGSRVSRLFVLHKQICVYFSLPTTLLAVNIISNIIMSVIVFSVMPLKYNMKSVETLTSIYNFIFLCSVANQVDTEVRFNQYIFIIS